MADPAYRYDRDRMIALRAQRRWTPRMLATVAGVDARTIARMEDPHAKRQVATATTLALIARALECPVKELASEVPGPEYRPRPVYAGPRRKWFADPPENPPRSAQRRMLRQAPPFEGVA